MTATMLVACGAKDEKKSVVPTVRVAEAEACGNAVSQQYPGKVVSADDANVSFKVAGTLRQINVKEGQHVRRGQLLAVMDDSDYKVQLKATEAEHAQIKAEALWLRSFYYFYLTALYDNEPLCLMTSSAGDHPENSNPEAKNFSIIPFILALPNILFC